MNSQIISKFDILCIAQMIKPCWLNRLVTLKFIEITFIKYIDFFLNA